jgi:hypothetical protein
MKLRLAIDEAACAGQSETGTRIIARITASSPRDCLSANLISGLTPALARALPLALLYFIVGMRWTVYAFRANK